MSFKNASKLNGRNARQLCEELLAGSADPILTFDYVKADLGISHATFYRGPHRELPIVQISARRFGVRRSDYEKWKASRIRPAAA